MGEYVNNSLAFAPVLITKAGINKYPLPLIDPSYEPLSHAWILTKLDLHNAYHHVRIWVGTNVRRHSTPPLVTLNTW